MSISGASGGFLPTDPVYRIVQRFQRAHYGPEVSSEGDLEDLRKDWREITDFVDEEEL